MIDKTPMCITNLSKFIYLEGCTSYSNLHYSKGKKSVIVKSGKRVGQSYYLLKLSLSLTSNKILITKEPEPESKNRRNPKY